MSIQPISSNQNNPYVNALATDFQTLLNDIKAYENSPSTGNSSGNTDQVSLSQDAMNKMMAQIQNDIANLSQHAQGTQGHHHYHHHHHGMDAANSSATSGSSSGITANSSGSTAGSSTTPISTTMDLSSLLSNSYGSQSQNIASTINLTA